jgi:hypothetical protein
MLDHVEVSAAGAISLLQARQYADAGAERLYVDDLTRGPAVLDVRLILPRPTKVPTQRV